MTPPVLTSATRHLKMTAVISESPLIGQKKIREKKTFSNNEIFMLFLTANKSPGTWGKRILVASQMTQYYNTR